MNVEWFKFKKKSPGPNVGYKNEVYTLSGPSMKHGRTEAHPSFSHSGLHWGNIYFCGKNDVICYVIVYGICFSKKIPKKIYGAKLIFWSFATFFGLTKQRFCFTGCRSVWNQTARILALDFLARWQLTSPALYYNLPYNNVYCNLSSNFFHLAWKWNLLRLKNIM